MLSPLTFSSISSSLNSRDACNYLHYAIHFFLYVSTSFKLILVHSDCLNKMKCYRMTVGSSCVSVLVASWKAVYIIPDLRRDSSLKTFTLH